MFEKFRIGAALFSARDAVVRDGTYVDRSVIKTFTQPLFAHAAADMRAHALKADQAAAALYIQLIEGMHEDGLLKRTMTEEYFAYQSLFQLYCYYYGLVADQPAYFAAAHKHMKDETFRQIMNY